MDLETRLDHIRQVGEEIITEGELRTLLETDDHPTAYDGFEPSGLANLAHARANLKRGVGESLDRIIAPVRNHFEKDAGARRLYLSVRSAETTR